MRKFFFSKPCPGYNDGIVHAYVSYGSEEKPTGHDGKALGEHYQNFEGFKKHIEEKIVPDMNKVLKGSGYVVDGVGDINNAPHPVVNIRRCDKQKLTENNVVNEKDKLLIEAQLLKAANKINEIKQKMAKITMAFIGSAVEQVKKAKQQSDQSKVEKSDQSKVEMQPRYNLRQR